MKRVVWLTQLRNQLTRHRRRTGSGPLPAESLEPRALLSATSALVGTELHVFANHNEAIAVRPDPNGTGRAQVLINGAVDTSLRNVQTSQLSAIRIFAGPGNNRIDLSAVSSANFSFTAPGTGLGMQILVEGGDGNDTILGSVDLNDTLRGGDGHDVINDPLRIPLGALTIDGGDGNDVIYGGALADTIDGGDGNDLIIGDAGDDVIQGGDGDDGISGGAGNDSLTGGDGRDSILGGLGDDSLDGGAGADTLQGDDGNDSITGGADADLINGDGGANGGDDTIRGEAGADTIASGGGNDLIDGGSGADLLGVAGVSSNPLELSVSDVTITEGDNFGVIALFSVTLSAPSAFPVTVDIATVDDTAVAGQDFVAASQTLAFAPGITTQTFAVTITGDLRPELTERFFVVLSNAVGAAIADPAGEGIIEDGNDGPNQVVFLDFDSATDGFDHVYTQAERNAIQARLAEDYALFKTTFTQTRPVFGAFTTLLFNEPPPGGLAEEIDFRNLNLNLRATIDINGFLGNIGAPPATSQNFIELTAKVAAHELGHLMGLRHGDAYGPIGSGITLTPGPFAYNPLYPGPTGAIESNRHIMGSPASTGETLFDAVSNQYFGAREAVKLSMWAYQGQVIPEQAQPHASLLTAQPINLAELPVPNTEQNGPLAGLVFDVTATAITGSLSVAGEVDFYSFTASAGDILNVEVLSQALVGGPQDRFSDPIDPVLSILDINGNAIPYYSGTAINDDEFETADSILIDLVIPTDGTYFIRVADFATDTGSYEVFAWTFDANPPADPPGTITVGQPVPGQVTLYGGDGNDTLIGTDSDDVIHGGDGNDVIDAAGGNDLVFGAGGRDSIRGGAGNDSLYGQGGIDTLIGDAGDDFIDGGASRDRLLGDDAAGVESGNDTIVGGAGNDLIFAGAGNDFVLGGGGLDTLHGEAGNDTLNGQAGRDSLVGGDGDDNLIWRGDGNDTLDGGEGLDRADINGTHGADTIAIGSSGSTLTVTQSGSVLSIANVDGSIANPMEVIRISGLAGNDTITIGSIGSVGALILQIDGGAGDDFVNGEGALTGSARILIDGGIGNDTLRGTMGDDTILGGVGNDSLRGGNGNDTLQGGAGSDTLDGMGGNDLLLGEDQNDTLIGGDGDDTINGGAGDDSALGGDGNDSILGSFGRDTLLGDAGNDTLLGGASDDALIGGGGNDFLNGGVGNDTLLGNAGADRITGDDGDDVINGGDGNDTINAGDGHDTIDAGDGNDGVDAGDGNDVVIGGAGRDTLAGGDGNDTLIGGADADTLLGQLGNDVLTGNGGADTFDGGEGFNALTDVAAVDQVFDSVNSFPLTNDLLNNLTITP